MLPILHDNPWGKARMSLRAIDNSHLAGAGDNLPLSLPLRRWFRSHLTALVGPLLLDALMLVLRNYPLVIRSSGCSVNTRRLNGRGGRLKSLQPFAMLNSIKGA
jgi:hypothetical protein